VQNVYKYTQKYIEFLIFLRLATASDRGSVSRLIEESMDSWRTKQYDWFQWKTNSIEM
jgi:hypothetical protein